MDIDLHLQQLVYQRIAFISKTEISTDKSQFHYGRKDGEYHEFTESVSRT